MDPRQQQIRQITETFHEKVAAYLRPEQAEDYMGAGVLPKRTMDLIRNLTKEETDKSFSLRHPWLTGIPTLGIAPATAKRKALDRIYRSVLRDPESAGTIQQRWDEKRKRQRAGRVFDLKQQQIDLVRDKAVQQRRAIVEAMGQAAGAAKHVADRKWGAPQEKTAAVFGASMDPLVGSLSPEVKKKHQLQLALKYYADKAGEKKTKTWKALVGGGAPLGGLGALLGGALGGRKGALLGLLGGGGLGALSGYGFKRGDDKELEAAGHLMSLPRKEQIQRLLDEIEDRRESNKIDMDFDAQEGWDAQRDQERRYHSLLRRGDLK